MPSSAIAQGIPYDISQTMSASHFPNRISLIGFWPPVISGTCANSFRRPAPALPHGPAGGLNQSRKPLAQQTAFVDFPPEKPRVWILNFCIARAEVEIP
jgi:hypothetical protein